MTQANSQSCVADRLAPFGTTIFAQMTRLAIEHKAVNLSQGFPDFDGPQFVKDAATQAMAQGQNQYARSQGVPALNESIAAYWKTQTGQSLNPDTQITVTSGCTEALPATFLGLINPGDEVIMFEPFYDSYQACAAMAGASVRFVTLRPPAEGSGAFTFDEAELRAAFTSKTRAILVNTPHNPTGKVFTQAELELISRLCIEHDVLAFTDEVYEQLVFDDSLPHIRLATLPGMWERTVTLSSLGKTFSLTGWKIGWVIAPEHLTAGVRAAHQFLTYATSTPLQHGAAAAMAADGPGKAYIEGLVNQYAQARQYLGRELERVGFRVFMPAGTYFIMADHTPISGPLGLEDDVAFCQHLTAKIGVAAIPPSAFYADPAHGKSLVRFAFCKTMPTLEEAVKRMAALG